MGLHLFHTLNYRQSVSRLTHSIALQYDYFLWLFAAKFRYTCTLKGVIDRLVFGMVAHYCFFLLISIRIGCVQLFAWKFVFSVCI